MGLDTFDIMLCIEDRLGCELSQEELGGLLRDRDIYVGDLYTLVLQKLYLHDFARYDIRLNHHLWTEIRGYLHSTTSVPRKQITLGTPLADLFPRRNRRELWQTFRAACPYRLRELDYPPLVRTCGFALAMGVVIIEHFHIWQIPGAKVLWPLLGVLAIWMVTETYLKILSICAPLRTSFPSAMSTVKDLCRAALAANYQDICESVEIPFDQRSIAVWEQLTDILADCLGVEPAAVTFRSRLIRDLGMS